MTRVEKFKANCKRYIEIGGITAPLDKEKKALKKDIDAFTNGERTVEGRYAVDYIEVKGGIDIDALLADHPEIDVEKYRKASSTRIQVKIVEA